MRAPPPVAEVFLAPPPPQQPQPQSTPTPTPPGEPARAAAARDRPGPADRAELQRHLRLARRNQDRLRPTLGDSPSLFYLWAELGDRELEEAFIAASRKAVAPLIDDVPTDADRFVAWFQDLAHVGPGQNDPLFPWLAGQASLEQMRWFLGQEIAGEAGFEDLTALTQIRMPTRIKLEMARNYWDEMGRGHAAGMHGPMLDDLARALGVALPLEATVWEPLALANLMVALAWNRHYAYQSVGALGVIELTAPGRAQQVNAGLQRLGASPGARKYFALHATLDLQHAAAWSREVLHPLVAADPRCARPLAEGAMLRLQAGARCFERYRRHLGLPGPTAVD